MKSVAYWQQHPISHDECLNQFKRLREQRLARESILKGEDGHLYFIDTIIFKTGTGGYNTYHSLSP